VDAIQNLAIKLVHQRAHLPRRTLVLSDAATALRVSEILGLMWMDLNFEDLVMYVRRAYVWGRFKEPKSKASKAPFPCIRYSPAFF
jgi:integrase